MSGAPGVRAAREAGDVRHKALVRFASAITLFTLAGHLFLGFEQAWIQPVVGLAAAYTTELLLEWIEAWSQGRACRFAGGGRALVAFLLPAHITGLATAMLLYSGDRSMPIVFSATVAIASKYVLLVPVSGRLRHFLNPSNIGITVTLLLFPWVGIAMPYMFTENLTGLGDLLLPAAIVVSGTLLNAFLTRRLILIGTWWLGFAVQAWLRSAVFASPLEAALLPATGVAFILFSVYMAPDPSTTPSGPLGQVLFGAGLAATYGLLMANQVVFGLFFSLSIVCVARGLVLYARAVLVADSQAAPTPAAAAQLAAN
jgi:hypothetical protein